MSLYDNRFRILSKVYIEGGFILNQNWSANFGENLMIAGLQVASCLPTTAGQVQLSGQTHQWCLVIFQSKYLEENASIANNYSTSNIALLLRQNGFFHVPRDST